MHAKREDEDNGYNISREENEAGEDDSPVIYSRVRKTEAPQQNRNYSWISVFAHFFSGMKVGNCSKEPFAVDAELTKMHPIVRLIYRAANNDASQTCASQQN